MQSTELGVVSPEEEPNPQAQTPENGGAEEEGTQGAPHSDEGQGTGTGAAKTPDEQNSQNGTVKLKDGQELGAEEVDERINGLMSKWQNADNEARTYKEQVEAYQNQFGPLQNGQQPQQQTTPQTQPQQHQQGQPHDEDLPVELQPGWQPKSMEELQQGLKNIYVHASQKAVQSIEEKQKTEQQARQQAQEQLDSFVSEVKGADPNFNEKDFFGYASKNNFSLNSIDDLRSVYGAYVDRQRAVRQAQKSANENKNARSGIPVSQPGGQGGDGNGVSYGQIRNAHSAHDLALDMLKRGTN